MHKRFGIQSLFWTAIVSLSLGAIVGIFWPNIAQRLEQPSSINATLPEDLDLTELQKMYDILRKEYDGELDVKELLDGAKAGLARGVGDPYTVYLDDEAAEEFQNSLEGTFSGIGAEIAVKNGQLQVVTPLSGSPAEAAGLRPGDPIIAVDGNSTEGITVEEAVADIRGEEGTEVVLTVVRSGEPKEISITRDVINVPSVVSSVIKGDIGLIELSRFGEDTPSEIRKAAEGFAAQGIDKVILDVRYNPGGLLDTAVKVSSVWIDDKVVVQQRISGGEMEPLFASSGAILSDVNTVVLINGGSASASEIVAGALQDYKIATIIGTQSFGKGSVQSLEKVGRSSLLKITIARWFTPDGASIDETGITPDIEVELSEEDFNEDRDPQLDRAIEILNNG